MSSNVEIVFSQSSAEVDSYAFVEVTLNVSDASVANPFTDGRVTGWFKLAGGVTRYVDGFCDASDGSIYRIRFMPMGAGAYEYGLTYRQGNGIQHKHAGRFVARDGGRHGLLRVDPVYPWHFLWEGTGEHYFYNGTTAYWLMGWDDATIRQSIDRLHRLRINRLRVALSGRVESARAWCEHVYPTNRFTFLLNPWVAKQPESVDDPRFDVTRFNVSYWQKCERMLAFARERDVVVSVVFYVDGRRPGVDPFGDAESEDELRYYRYAIARLSPFSNVTWDITNEYRHFRSDPWADRMGAYLKAHDPYDHLVSVHGHDTFRFRTRPWADFAMYQCWDEHGGNQYMLGNRKQQEETGRIIPQVNEEYGYEDHYPTGWGGKRIHPARDADSRRRIAWEISMAGSYQTTGERANTGTGWGSDTGGGWVNGRGDDAMTMLHGYGHMVDFFTSFEWWRAEPCNELILEYDGGRFDHIPYFTSGDHGARVQRTGQPLCLAIRGEAYAVYLPAGGNATVSLVQGAYAIKRFNPHTGEWVEMPVTRGDRWSTPDVPDHGDWAFLLRHVELSASPGKYPE